MKYYFVIKNNDTFIEQFDTLEELETYVSYYINDDYNWYIIEGKVIKRNVK